MRRMKLWSINRWLRHIGIAIVVIVDYAGVDDAPLTYIGLATTDWIERHESNLMVFDPKFSR